MPAVTVLFSGRGHKKHAWLCVSDGPEFFSVGSQRDGMLEQLTAGGDFSLMILSICYQCKRGEMLKDAFLDNSKKYELYWFTEIAFFNLCRGCLLWHGVDGGEDGSEGA